MSFVQNIYGNIPGVVPMNYSDGEVMYTLPCDTKMNISFTFK